MKIPKYLLTITLILSFSLTSCTDNSEENSNQNSEINIDKSSIKNDASRLVKLQCKVMQLVGEAKAGNKTALMESEKFNAEAEKVSRELKEKYTTEKEQERFAEAYEDALGECD